MTEQALLSSSIQKIQNYALYMYIYTKILLFKNSAYHAHWDKRYQVMRIIVQIKIHASVSTDSTNKMYLCKCTRFPPFKAQEQHMWRRGRTAHVQGRSGLVNRACNVGGSPKFEFTVSAMCFSQNVNRRYIYCAINFEFFSGFLWGAGTEFH